MVEAVIRLVARYAAEQTPAMPRLQELAQEEEEHTASHHHL